MQRRELLMQYMRHELKDLKGQMWHEACAEVVWKWHERLAMDICEKKRWWIHCGRVVLLRLKVRRTRKEHDTGMIQQ